MKNKTKILAAGAALVALSPLAAKDGLAASATINIDARVLAAIQLAEVQPLDFGTFSVAGADTIVVNPVGLDVIGGNINEIATATPNEATFQIKAAIGFNIDIAVAATEVTLTNGGTGTMKVNAFNVLTDANGTAGVVNLAAATETHPIGATLNVGAGQAAGTYVGTFSVTGSYQ